MSNLIPEVRVNKNGVPVKKYVKADTGSSNGKVLPAPALSFQTEEERPVTAEDIRDLLRSTETQYSVIALTRADINRLSEFPSETLKKAAKVIKEWPDKSLEGLSTLLGPNLRNQNLFDVCVTLADDVRKMYSPDDAGDPIRHITAACNKHEITRMDTDPTDYHYGLIKAEVIAQSLYLDSPFRALVPHQQSMFLEDIRRHLDVIEPAAPVIAAIGTLTGLDDEGQDFDEVLWTAEFVNRFPGQAVKIANMVLDRGEWDDEIIEGILTSESPAISEGIL
jgi:hypothetical protein